MQKYRTAGAAHHRSHVVADYHHKIVDRIVEPHRLGMSRVGQPDEAVIIAIGRIIDPSVARLQSAKRQAGARRRYPIGAIERRNQREHAGGCGAVAFGLVRVTPVRPIAARALPSPQTSQPSRYSRFWSAEVSFAEAAFTIPAAANCTGNVSNARRATSTDQYICCPPLTDSVEPVMKSASSATRNSTVREMSSACPSRPTGMRAMIFSRTSAGTARTISVST